MIRLSKPIVELINRFRLNPGKLPDNFRMVLNCEKEAKKDDFDYTLATSEYNYINKNLELVPIGDVIGTNGIIENTYLLEYVSNLYNDKHEYGKRSLWHLENSIPDNIKLINDTASTKPIKVIKIKDKYYVYGDGNHKTFYLLLMYYIECELCKDNPKALESIKDRYNIKMLVSKKSDYKIINKICYCLIKSQNKDIRMEFSSNQEQIGFLTLEGQEIDIHSEQEFISHFCTYLNSLDINSDKFQILLYWLLKTGYFKEEIVKQVHGLYDDNVVLNANRKR